MNSNSRTNLLGIIAVAETILLFASGVIGSKVAESLKISEAAILFLTFVCLLALSVVSYVKTQNPNSNTLVKHTGSRVDVSFRRFVPKTALGIFPFGVLWGWLIGVVIPKMDVSAFSRFVPSWLPGIFGYSGISITTSEFAGFVIGIFGLVLFALAVDNVLAASMTIGFGIAFPTALLNQSSSFFFGHFSTPTYIGHTGGAIVAAVLLVILSPVFKWLKIALTKPRL
jgi:hypothetical protein